MLLTIISVIYVLVAIAMIVLILMQRGSGAAAGSGFGGGASATVFGARGSANFLSTTTKWLALVFFLMSLGMAWNATRTTTRMPVEEDIGAMSEVPVAAPATQVPAASGDVPVIPAAPAAVEAPAVVPVESTEASPSVPAAAESDDKGSPEG